MIWYPYEQMKTMKSPYQIVDAQGVYLYTEDQKLIDSVSSWWSVIHGYKHPELNKAMEGQIEKFSHVMLGGLTHEPVSYTHLLHRQNNFVIFFDGKEM